MAKNSGRSSGGNRSDWGVMEMARERPIAAAAAAAGAAAAGLFLWSRRASISNQLSNLSDQIGEWTEGMRGDSGDFGMDDTAGLTTSTSTGSRATGTRSGSSSGRTRSSGSRRGMSETGGGNASLGARSGGGGMASSASGRGRAQQTTP
jgi:hypothetical protein